MDFTPKEHYEFVVPYIEYAEEGAPAQSFEIWPAEGIGYCLQYRYDGEVFASVSHVHLEAAMVMCRHLMGVACIQGSPEVIRTYMEAICK